LSADKGAFDCREMESRMVNFDHSVAKSTIDGSLGDNEAKEMVRVRRCE